MYQQFKKNMKTTDLKNVFFKPYVGNEYENGLILKEDGIIEAGTEEKKGLKVMVLGESHYCGEKCKDCGIASSYVENKCKEFTKNVVTSYLDYLNDKTEFEPWMNTFTKFSKALTGKDERSKDIWKSIIYYNYIQRAMNTARTRPDSDDFKESEDAFFDILQEYKPNVIICWGNRLFDNLPSKNGDYGKIIAIGERKYYTWYYQLKGFKASLLSIYHPSVGFNWESWNKVIIEFFKTINHEL